MASGSNFMASVAAVRVSEFAVGILKVGHCTSIITRMII